MIRKTDTRNPLNRRAPPKPRTVSFEFIETERIWRSGTVKLPEDVQTDDDIREYLEEVKWEFSESYDTESVDTTSIEWKWDSDG